MANKKFQTFKDYEVKDSVVVVYTGDGKGKTSASLGLLARGLGSGWKCAYIQFIKHWEVSEHAFIQKIEPLFGENLYFYKGGKGFYEAGELSAKDITPEQHRAAAQATFETALTAATSGDYALVICDEINNAVHDGLISEAQLANIISSRHKNTNLCLTGRNFPEALIPLTDIATNMSKIKHHFDDKFLANKGIDF